jgi:hypothetical protein
MRWQPVITGGALQQQVGRVTEHRDQGVKESTRDPLDVERVADPGEHAEEHHLIAHDCGIEEPLRVRLANLQEDQGGQTGSVGPHRAGGHHGLDDVAAAY